MRGEVRGSFGKKISVERDGVGRDIVYSGFPRYSISSYSFATETHMGSTSGLQQLHLLHLQLKEVLDALDRGPKQIKAKQQFVAQRAAELEGQREKQKKLKVSLDQANLQLKSNESKLDQLKGKLNAANSNKEYEVFTAQIEADTMAKSVLEDEILGMLDKLDESKGLVAAAEKNLESAKADEAKLTAEVSAAEAGLKSKVADLQEKIRQSESVIPGDIQGQFRRMVAQNGADAFAEVDGDVCTGCYVGLPPQTFVELKTGKVLFCKSCGRLMYLRPVDAV